MCHICDRYRFMHILELQIKLIFELFTDISKISIFLLLSLQHAPGKTEHQDSIAQMLQGGVIQCIYKAYKLAIKGSTLGVGMSEGFVNCCW
jgi:hypothetical protein